MALFKLYNVVNCISCNLTVESIRSTLATRSKPINVHCFVKRFSSKRVMKVLNVAEKHDAAKNIAAHLSRGNNRKVNNIYFTYLIDEESLIVSLIVTLLDKSTCYREKVYLSITKSLILMYNCGDKIAKW